LEAAGVPLDDTLIVRTDLNREDGCTAALNLLGRPDRPTAIFACNDGGDQHRMRDMAV
jgi:DNA-binding LacI/PurR family transcriptional regulator